jgi:hypothetical protein
MKINPYGLVELEKIGKKNIIIKCPILGFSVKQIEFRKWYKIGHEMKGIMQ